MHVFWYKGHDTLAGNRRLLPAPVSGAGNRRQRLSSVSYFSGTRFLPAPVAGARLNMFNSVPVTGAKAEL